MNKKPSNRVLIKKCVEVGLNPQATIDFVSDSLKERIRKWVSRIYPKFLAMKLLAAGTPPEKVHSQITWILKEDFGLGMKASEKKASKIVGWKEPKPYRVKRVRQRR